MPARAPVMPQRTPSVQVIARNSVLERTAQCAFLLCDGKQSRIELHEGVITRAVFGMAGVTRGGFGPRLTLRAGPLELVKRSLPLLFHFRLNAGRTGLKVAALVN